eukprot:Seg1787.2 transcript_id=Seg1787.2/GoldUCD/mRNA.D3Y31 product="hypothetical protein" protein_id=Seg1787.2/GoldUCD/D3Y31
MNIAMQTELKQRAVLDTIENIKNVKKKKLDRKLIAEDSTELLGLSEDETMLALEGLIEKGILVDSDGSLGTANREKLQLTMEYSRIWKEDSSRDVQAALKENISISI